MSSNVLFATYQPENPDLKKGCERIDSDILVSLEKAVGFEPVWCFSFSNEDEFVGKSILSAPSCPEVLYIFEPPADAVPIDIIQWNRLITRKDRCTPEAVGEIVGEGTNPRYAEWLCPGIPDEARTYFAMDLGTLLKEGAFQGKDGREWGELFRKKLETARKWLGDEGEVPPQPDDFAGTDWPEFVRRNNGKLLFEDVWARYIAHYALVRSGLKKSMANIFDVYPEMLGPSLREPLDRKMSDVYKGIYAEGPSYEEYDELLRLLDIKLDSAYAQMKKETFGNIGRNDLCPCGSGKKYKKCHMNRVRAFSREKTQGDIILGDYSVGAMATKPVETTGADRGATTPRGTARPEAVAVKNAPEIRNGRNNVRQNEQLRIWNEKNRQITATANYIARLEILPADNGVDAYTVTVSVIENWVKEKELRRLSGELPDVAKDWLPELETALGRGRMRRLAPGAKRTEDSVRIDLNSCSQEGGLVDAWAIEYNEPDSSARGRRWDTLVGVRRTDFGCVLNVENRYYTVADYIGPDHEKPDPSTPKFVKGLIHSKMLRCADGSSRVSDIVEHIDTPTKVDELRAKILDSERKMPIVLVASNESGEYIANARTLAKQLIGMAHVYSFDWTRYFAREELERLVEVGDFPQEYVFDKGSVAVYDPVPSIDGSASIEKPNMFARRDIESLTRGKPYEFDVCLRRSFTRRAIGGHFGEIRRPADVQGIQFRRRAEERRAEARRLREGADADSRSREVAAREVDDLIRKLDEVKGAAANSNEELAKTTAANIKLAKIVESQKAQIAKLEGESKGWENLAIEASDEADEQREKAEEAEKSLDARTDECDSLRHEVDRRQQTIEMLSSQSSSLRIEAKEAKDGLERVTGVDHIPSTLPEVLEFIQHVWPSKVVVLDEAFASAMDFPGKDLDEEWQILRSVPTILWDIYFKDDLANKVEEEYRNRTGYELALHEKKQTRADKNLMNQRKRNYRGEDIYVVPHVKGRSTKPSDSFRVNFYVDRDRKLIVIGHCGGHLGTSGTRKNA